MINLKKIKKTTPKLAKISKKNIIIVLQLIFIAFLLGIVLDKINFSKNQNPSSTIQTVQKTNQNLEKIQGEVVKEKYVFNIKWGDLGKNMVRDGVLDKQKLAKAITGTDKLPQDLDKYLISSQNSIELTQQNAQFWVDVLWGLGLANRNPILDSGPMVEGGNTANFASTGGYTIGVNKPMDIYSKYKYINLSDFQQKNVYEIASNIYRPCCGNSTAFPDCNHGMAALGLIELMVSQNFSKDDIYKTVLAFNTYWFPQTYLDAAYYFQENGRDYSKVPPKELLSQTFSSAMGYQVIHKKVGDLKWPALQNGGSCGA